MSDDVPDDAMQKRFLPPVYFLAAVVLMVWLHFLIPLERVIKTPYTWLGLLPVLIGIIINVVADGEFKRQGTTVKPFQRSSTLVTGGLFRLSRNPMYLGIILILFGIAAFLGTVSPFVVVPLFVWVITVRFIHVEEAMLEEEFGDAFVDYKRKVRRWL